MRQLERAFAAEREAPFDADPSATTLLAEVTKPVRPLRDMQPSAEGRTSAAESEVDPQREVRRLVGARAVLCGANAAAPFLALCDGDFLRETLSDGTREAISARPPLARPLLGQPTLSCTEEGSEAASDEAHSAQKEEAWSCRAQRGQKR